MLFENINIGQITNISEFSKSVGLPEAQLRYILNSKEKCIKRGVVSKRDGSSRIVTSANFDPLKSLLHNLAEFLYAQYVPSLSGSAHGFIKGRSIVTNAQQHTQKKSVLNIDIEKFFDSISIDRIIEIFVSVGFRRDIAQILSELVTVDQVLATGFSTSPILSNIVCIAMDKVFEEIAHKKSFVYTRYVDDMTFSSNTYTPSQEEVHTILNQFGFRINKSKVRMYSRGGPQYVTGLTVVDRKPRLSKRLKKSIRLELYYIKKYGLIEHLSRGALFSMQKNEHVSKLSQMLIRGYYSTKGFIDFVYPIEPSVAKSMRDILLREQLWYDMLIK